MNLSRRRLLSACGLLGASFAGCLGRAPRSPTDDGPTREPVRGAADPVTVERTVDDEELEYLEATDEVRYVAAYRHTNHDEVENASKPEREPVYETTPFERWGETECAHAAALEVGDIIENAFDGGANTSPGVTTRDGKKVVEADYHTHLDRDGDVISKPSVEFERVVEVTPRSVTATVSLEGHEHADTVPVFVRRATIQNH